MPRPCRMRGLQIVDSWSSRPGEPFAGLPKCFEGNGQKEVSCAGLHGPARAARAALGGVTRMGLVRVPPPRKAHSLLYENQCQAMDSCGVMGMLWGLSAGVHVSCVRRIADTGQLASTMLVGLSCSSSTGLSGGACQVVRPAVTAMAASTW